MTAIERGRTTGGREGAVCEKKDTGPAPGRDAIRTGRVRCFWGPSEPSKAKERPGLVVG